MPEDEPFRPRMRPRAFLRMLRPRPGPPGGFDLLAMGAFGFTLFAFSRLVVAIGSVDPAGGSASALAAGGSGTTWLMLGVGSLAILAYALHRTRAPAVTLKPDLLHRTRR